MKGEELSKLNAISRLAMLGPIKAVIIIGVLSFFISVYFSYEKYASINAINIEKQENLKIIVEQQRAITEKSTELELLIINEQNQELKNKIMEYQREIEKLLEQSKETKKILEKDIKSNYKGSVLKFEIISSAYADNHDVIPQIKKQNVFWAILGLLALVYLGALYSLFFSIKPRNIELATDLVKTLTGFYIGIATTVVG